MAKFHTRRAAKVLLDALIEFSRDVPHADTSMMYLRAIAMRLQMLRLQPHDLDQENACAAVVAVLKAMTRDEVEELAENNALTLEARWARVVNRASELEIWF